MVRKSYLRSLNAVLNPRIASWQGVEGDYAADSDEHRSSEAFIVSTHIPYTHHHITCGIFHNGSAKMAPFQAAVSLTWRHLFTSMT
jgi:hypothetical protein